MTACRAYRIAVRLLRDGNINTVPVDIIATLEAAGFIWADLVRAYTNPTHNHG